MEKIKKMFEQIKNRVKYVVTMTTVLLPATLLSVSADDAGPGVDSTEAKNLIKRFTDPIKEILLWVVPAAAIIGTLIMGVSYFFKTEQEKEDYDLIGKIVKYGLIASLLQGIAIVFKVFGVVN